MGKIKREIKCKKNGGRIKHSYIIIDEKKFASGLESDFYLKLKKDKKDGKIKDFKMQETFVLQDKYILIDKKVIYGSDENFEKIKRKNKAPTISAIKYISDYVVETNDGEIHVIDTKGKSTTDFEIKKRLFKAKFPKYNFHVITKYKGEWMDYYEAEKKKSDRRKIRKQEKAEKEESMQGKLNAKKR